MSVAKFDPYVVLGLKHTASKVAIRSRYRALSKKFHPDVDAGHRDTFDQLTLAHRILTDPARKARYDATGEINDVVVPNPDQLPIGLLAQTICQLLADPADLLSHNLVEIARMKLAESQKTQLQNIQANLVLQDRVNRALNRFVLAKPATVDAENIILASLTSHLDALKKAHGQMTNQAKAFGRAIEILEAYGFVPEVMHTYQPTSASTATSFNNGGFGFRT